MILAQQDDDRVSPVPVVILSFLPHIMGNKAEEFDGLKFGYLGGPSPYDTVYTFNNEAIDAWSSVSERRQSTGAAS
jgi:hypothetical protein